MYDQLKLDNQLCFRLYAASRLVTQAYRPLLEPLGLTYPQYLVMLLLWEKDWQSVNDIAHRLLLETNTVTPLLKRMEQEGLVKRNTDFIDKRRTIVGLTHKGKKLEEAAKTIPACITQGWSDGQSRPEDFAALSLLLDALISKLKSNDN